MNARAKGSKRLENPLYAPAAPDTGPLPSTAAESNGDTDGDVLAAAGIRPWCRGLILLFAHPHHLTLPHVIDAVTAAADSSGLTPQEAALLAEVRAGEIAKQCQSVRRIVS